MIDYVAIALTLAGIGLFGYAADVESSDGSPTRRTLWCSLSALISILVLFVAGLGWLPWLIAQALLFVGIAAVRVWLEDREGKDS